jgi:tryptophan halogenase
MTYNICIVGGGSSGWMAAAYLKSIYQDLVNIEIIYDHSRPNIGVGESTTPVILEFLNQIGISYQDLISEIGSTIKLGIKFKNWSADQSHYWHPFNITSFDPNVRDSNILSAYETFLEKNYNAECYDPEYLNSGKVPVNDKFESISNFALHIDGDKFSKLIKTKFEKYVNVINDVVETVHIENTNISKLKLKSGNEITADLFIDCSGLSRLLISKVTDSWTEATAFPLMNRSIPIQIHEAPDLSQTYTIAEAHKFGWLWKIPLQERYGIGYNYNSQYLSDDTAIKNFQEILKLHNINYQDNFKIIKYNPGYFKEQWKSNVLAVGLSTGFVEPLEATAIHMVCNQLMHFVRHNTFIDNNYSKDTYNKKMSNMYDQTFEFIELHYYVDRCDSEFWKDIKIKKNQNLLNLIEKANSSFLTASDILINFDRIQGSIIFGLTGYTRIMLGTKLLNTQGAKHFLKISGLAPLGKEVFNNVQTLKQNVKNVSIQSNTLYERIKNGKRNL